MRFTGVAVLPRGDDQGGLGAVPGRRGVGAGGSLSSSARQRTAPAARSRRPRGASPPLPRTSAAVAPAPWPTLASGHRGPADARPCRGDPGDRQAPGLDQRQRARPDGHRRRFPRGGGVRRRRAARRRSCTSNGPRDPRGSPGDHDSAGGAAGPRAAETMRRWAGALGRSTRRSRHRVGGLLLGFLLIAVLAVVVRADRPANATGELPAAATAVPSDPPPGAAGRRDLAVRRGRHVAVAVPVHPRVRRCGAAGDAGGRRRDGRRRGCARSTCSRPPTTLGTRGC